MPKPEIANAVYWALTRFDQQGLFNVYGKITWLWRAASYLLAGLTVEKNNARYEGDIEKLERARDTVEAVIQELKSKMRDERVYKAQLAANMSKGVSAKNVREVLELNVRLNELRDKIVGVMVATGFDVFKPVIVGDEE